MFLHFISLMNGLYGAYQSGPYGTYYLSLAQINGHLSAKQKLAQGID